MQRMRILAWSLVALVGLPLAGLGQDPVPLYPENYKVLLENDRVRVVDFQLRRGAKENAHSHPAHVAYVIKGFRIRFTLPDGSTRIRETRDGDVLFSEAVTHASENIGETDAHGILVELKGPAKAARAGENWVTAVTLIRGLEGKEEELRRELLALSAPTRAEPGAVTYDLYQSPEEKNQFLRFEVWRSLDDLEAHKRTPHIQASFARRQQQGWTTEITLWKWVGP